MYLSEKNHLEVLYYVVKCVLVLNLNKKKKIADGCNYEINWIHIKLINTTEYRQKG